MKLAPILKKKNKINSHHGITWEDPWGWVDQPDILSVLKDPKKLQKEVYSYIQQNNEYFNEKFMKATEVLRKKLVSEYKKRIRLEDTSLKFKNFKYYYWTKTTKEGQYPIKLRSLIGSNVEEELWNGDEEKKLHKSEFFSVGDLEISWSERVLGYSLDLTGAEKFKIFLRNISDKKIITKEIENTSGDIHFSLDDKYIFYTQLDDKHRPKKIFRHKIGSAEDDLLIYHEQNDRFSVSLGLTSDYKYWTIASGDHSSSVEYYFSAKEENPKLKLVQKREEDVKYSMDSWTVAGKNYFYLHSNKESKDFEIYRTKDDNMNGWEKYIPARKDVIIGGFTMLDDYMLRHEQADAKMKIFVRNLKNEKEEELTPYISDEPIINPGVSLMQRDTKTTKIFVGYDSMKTAGKTYEFDIVTKSKKLVKEIEIPSGDYRESDYILKRENCLGHDGEEIPMSIVYHKDAPSNSPVVLYGYGQYKSNSFFGFSNTRLSILMRNIKFCVAHVRGGGEKGDRWHKNGKLLKKENSFLDYLSVAKHLINTKYTSKGKIIALGGSAGGWLVAEVLNREPDLFLSAIVHCPFVDVLTTNLCEDLPLTPPEFLEVGRSLKNKDDFLNLRKLSPYEQIKKQNYPPILCVHAISDSRVLVTESVKWTAKLREFKTDDNLLLYKCELDSSHAGKTGRDNVFDELSIDHSFMCLTAGIKN